MGSPTGNLFDFVVVGAGNSGAVVAGNLAHSTARPRVLVIEAGGPNTRDDLYVPSERFANVYKNEEIKIGYRTVPQNHIHGRILEYVRGKGLGGSSVANFMAYIRGSASDYNVWGDLVGDDFFKWENAVERFKELENLHLDDDGDEFIKLREGVHGFNGPLDITLPSRRQWPPALDILMKAALDFGWPLNPDQNSGDLVGIGVLSVTSYQGRRTTSASAYLSNPPSNLEIWTDSKVTKVLMDDAHSSGKPKAIGVLLADGREVRASKEVILSLGTIDTPKLLLLSGIGPRSELQDLGLECIIDNAQVGKGLTDHLYVVTQWGARSQFGDEVGFEKDSKMVAAAREQWMRNHTGPDATRHLTTLIGFLKLDPHRHSFDELEILDARAKAWIKQPNVPQIEIFLQGVSLEEWDKSHGEEPLIACVMLMNPQSRGSVTLASKDPAADPVIDVNFFSHPYDRQTLVSGVREVMTFVRSKHLSKHIASAVLAPKTDSDEDILAFCKDTLMSVLHGVGTAKMGHRDDPKACVDTDFRVRDVDNLRVMDLSVCPVLTNNHTQATAYVVGQMGWKKLAAEYGL
ncbi:uncharacterized protein Z518_00197 [Rhinocladiella mackenziei CBS 650.93]|uniref:Glucose-methanol-choline oxidoreductase N-terminal domain-containing protein n=1 Tax=Rhinocladiella mackenziei CBS 650.93 TaxID=1442369 RepID=A0A0D2ISY7_9EURO|nr:uncharacterized protein Z518_00197 [Rhinocladiella mackenziei CBS 650.93]KIX09119.1 hypothetical protein Z518_00197 [Rhinocladiella mackenziei CBS 650.93]